MKNRGGKHEKHSKRNKKSNKPADTTAEKNSATTQNVWHHKQNLSDTLFPEAEAAAARNTYDEDIKRAIAESLKDYQAETTVAELPLDESLEEATGRFDDYNYWNTDKIHKNLPTTDEDVKRNSDANNNSSVLKSTERPTDKKIIDRPPSRPITPQKYSSVDENIKKFEKKFEEISLSNTSHSVDKYGRIDGCNERHIFMGTGARKKEREFLERQQEKNVESQSAEMSQLRESDKSQSREMSHPRESDKYDTSRDKKYSREMSNGRYQSQNSRKSINFVNDRYHYVKDNSRSQQNSRLVGNDEKVAAEKNNSSHQEKIPENSVTKKTESFSRSDDYREKKSSTEDKSVSKDLYLCDFNSRSNVLVEDKQTLPSKSQPEVGAFSTSYDLPKTDLNCPIGEDFSPKSELQYSATACASSPPGFPCFQHQSTQIVPENFTNNNQHLYERLAIFDPPLYRLLLQKQSSQSYQCTRINCQENFNNYDRQSTIKSYCIPEQRGSFYDTELSRNYPIPADNCSETMKNRFNPATNFNDFRNDRFHDNDQISGIQEHYQQNLTSYILNSIDQAGNIVRQEIVVPAQNRQISYPNEPIYPGYPYENIVTPETPRSQRFTESQEFSSTPNFIPLELESYNHRKLTPSGRVHDDRESVNFQSDFRENQQMNRKSRIPTKTKYTGIGRGNANNRQK